MRLAPVQIRLVMRSDWSRRTEYDRAGAGVLTRPAERGAAGFGELRFKERVLKSHRVRGHQDCDHPVVIIKE